MLKHGEVNPLNVHGLRRIDWCPPHFTSITMDLNVSQQTVNDWIVENLRSRYYIGIVDAADNSRRQLVVGFESPGEASYFGLFLPELNQAQSFW